MIAIFWVNVITEFKKRIGVDWVALGLTPPVPSATKCVYSPTKKIVFVGDEEITYYLFSAVDSVGDTSVHFYYQNGSWHVVFTTGNLVDVEMLNTRLYEIIPPTTELDYNKTYSLKFKEGIIQWVEE